MKKVLFIVTVFLAAACEREVRLASIEVTPEVTARAGDQTRLQVSYTPAEAIAPGSYHYKTSDQFVASVDNDGLLVCRHVGTCTIMIATADKRFATQCTVNVAAENNLYDEPVTDFGIGKTNVELQESDKTLLCETATVLVYQGKKSPVSRIIYVFDENQKLMASGVLLETGSSLKFNDFMTERYDRSDSENEIGLSVWRGQRTEITVKTYGEGDYVIYMPYSGTATQTEAKKVIESIRSLK